MKFQKLINIFLIGCVALAITSCQKEDIDNTSVEEEEQVTEVVNCDDWTMTIIDTIGPAGNGNLSPVSDGGTPPFTYLWSTGESIENIMVNNVGTYSLTMTDSEGCIVTAQIDVEFNDPCNSLFAQISEFTDTITTLTATISGGTQPYAYEWSNGATTQSITVTDDGIYTFFAIDAVGCTYQTSIEISNGGNNNLPCDDFTATLAEQPPGSGDIFTSVSGGTPPYAYMWSTGQTTSNISVDSSGVYSVSITDSNGCILWQEIQL